MLIRNGFQRFFVTEKRLILSIIFFTEYEQYHDRYVAN